MPLNNRFLVSLDDDTAKKIKDSARYYCISESARIRQIIMQSFQGKKVQSLSDEPETQEKPKKNKEKNPYMGVKNEILIDKYNELKDFINNHYSEELFIDTYKKIALIQQAYCIQNNFKPDDLLIYEEQIEADFTKFPILNGVCPECRYEQRIEKYNACQACVDKAKEELE